MGVTISKTRSFVRRRWLWLVAAVLVVAVAGVAVVWVREALRPDDPWEPGALPDNILYGTMDWSPRGSLASDAHLIREAAEKLDEDRKYTFLWAGRGDDGNPGRYAVFVHEAESAPSQYRIQVVRKEDDANDWYTYSGRGPSASLQNTIIPLPLNEVEGFPETESSLTRHFLVRDDVRSETVELLTDGRELIRDGVIRAEPAPDVSWLPSYAFAMGPEPEAVFTSPLLARPVRAEEWPSEQVALTALSTFGADPSTARFPDADEGLVELGSPELVELDTGTGVVITVRGPDDGSYRKEHGSRPEPAAHLLQRSGLIIVLPSAGSSVDDSPTAVLTGPASGGETRTPNPDRADLDPPSVAEYAVAVPDQDLRGGPYVVTTGGDVRTDPELPMLGEPVEPGGPTIFGSAPSSSVVTWRGEDGLPSGVALVSQEQDRQ